MLSIFYQWKSIAKMRINSEYGPDEVDLHHANRQAASRPGHRHGQPNQQPVGILLNKRPDIQSHLQQSGAQPSYFTFNKQDSQKRSKERMIANQYWPHQNESPFYKQEVAHHPPCSPRRLQRLLSLFKKQLRYRTRFAFTIWYRFSLYERMRALELRRDQFANNFQAGNHGMLEQVP